MTTTRFVSPSLPRRVLSRLSFAVYERIFSYLPFADILAWLPSFSDIIFTYICLYLFFFFYLALSVVSSFFQIRRINLFIHFFLFFFLPFFSRIRCEFQRNLFDLNFGSEIIDRGFERRFERYLFLSFFYPPLFVYFFFLSFFFQRNSILDP